MTTPEIKCNNCKKIINDDYCKLKGGEFWYCSQYCLIEKEVNFWEYPKKGIKTIPQRLIDLENKAKQTFIENSDWNGVVSCLDKSEQKEYWELFKETFGE